MPTPSVLIHPTPDLLAEAVAARTLTSLSDAQAARGVASAVLTGGGLGIACLESIAASPARDSVDWGAVDIWWGDERFLPSGDPDRNETQARKALLDGLPLDESRVHPMAATDGPDGDDVDAAAERYTRQLATAATLTGGGTAPSFDVLLLGVGPDGHVASLFPAHAGLDDARPAIPVRHSPKPPPTRISLSFATIRGAREVWLVAAGEGKAEAIRDAVAGATDVPAAGAAGRARTLWLLDQAAASLLPDDLLHP